MKRKRKCVDLTEQHSCHDEDPSKITNTTSRGASRLQNAVGTNKWSSGNRSSPTLQQHWLSEITFLCRSGTRSSVHIQEQQKPILESNCHESLSIKHLSYQLNQIKHQLWPAAIQCSKRCCAKHVKNKQVFHLARQICNPWERLMDGHHYGFINRSAIKLANINSLLNFELFGNSHRKTDDTCVSSPLTFVDLCGAPGGFSEYIFYMCEKVLRIPANGFGMSLVGTNQHGTGFEWNLQNPNFLIVNGSDGTGDIYKWGNIICLQNTILQHNYTSKVDLVVADGGLDIQRDSEIQETLTYELFVSQVAAALLLLREGGNFVVKFFGSHNSETKVVIQQLYNVFETLTIVKPIVSRPASSERYLVCLKFSPPTIPGKKQPWCDAQVWREGMIRLANHDHRSNDNQEHGNSLNPELEEFLTRNNREMLALNMKSCSDIVRKLTIMTPDEVKGRIAEEAPHQLPQNDIESYRSLWKLKHA